MRIPKFRHPPLEHWNYFQVETGKLLGHPSCPSRETHTARVADGAQFQLPYHLKRDKRGRGG